MSPLAVYSRESLAKALGVCWRVEGAQLLVAVKANLTALNAPDLLSRCDAAAAQGVFGVQLDLQCCRKIDRAGVRTLRAIATKARERGAALRILNASDAQQLLFRVAGVAPIAEVVE